MLLEQAGQMANAPLADPTKNPEAKEDVRNFLQAGQDAQQPPQ